MKADCVELRRFWIPLIMFFSLIYSRGN
jgi:hypothetical protein